MSQDVTRKQHVTQFEVEVDDGPNLEFSGSLLGFQSTEEHSGQAESANEEQRWKELTLYQTVGGNLVCTVSDCSASSVEGYTYSSKTTAKVFDKVEDVIGFFGKSELAQRLYKEADIKLGLMKIVKPIKVP